MGLDDIGLNVLTTRELQPGMDVITQDGQFGGKITEVDEGGV